jgi:hypothetical protein
MIYNLVEYCTTQLPSINFIANGFSPGSSIESVAIIQSGGDPNPWYDRNDYAIQVLSRAKDVTVAKANADSVFNLLTKKFGVELPSVTVNSVLYPSIITYRFRENQIPSYIGTDDENLEMWSFNLTVTTT